MYSIKMNKIPIMKQMKLKKIVLLKIILICYLTLNACAEAEENKNISAPPFSSEMPQQVNTQEVKPESTAANDIPPRQEQWQVYICPDMPQPYIEVLKQYEQFMNAKNQNINDESVQAKLWGGEWKYLYDELCGAWTSFLNSESAENPEDVFHYALKDITGDGFPEMIMAYKDIPDVIYNYSAANGIGMECLTSYYTMTIYENGIVEYVSGGAYSSTTYLRFQEETGEWVIADIIAVESTWDTVSKEWNDINYYTGTWDGNGELTETISEAEYLRIQEKYVTEPMAFEWIPLAYAGN